MSAHCDVFIMGAGLAGISAAYNIRNKSVILASGSAIASGASFYPGTWGLGVIGPENKGDEADLSQTIQSIGCVMCDPKLVDTLVSSITKQIQTLQDLHLPFQEVHEIKQKEFIPCFDHKQRSWNGLLTNAARAHFKHHIDQCAVKQLPYHEVVDIVMNENAVSGVVVLDRNNSLQYIGCNTIIIASGGMGGLFQYRLTPNDNHAMGQYLALQCGASLINIEFNQMMTGFLPPLSAIFNEKLYEYTRFRYQHNTLFTQEQDKLKQRSTYGPFTSRLPSKDIDITLYNIFKEDSNGITIQHDPALAKSPVEFIQTYRLWLEEHKHSRLEDKKQIGVFYHASNGGIRIDTNAYTGVKGLYACGEASGGMHGADRLGGMASANALVFGSIAGEQASRYHPLNESVKTIEYHSVCYEHADLYLEQVRAILFQNVMVVKNATGLRKAYRELEDITKKLVLTDSVDYHTHITSYHLRAALTLGKAMIQACELRKESRGSHYREDYPVCDHHMDRPILVTGKGRPHVQFQKKKVG